MCFIRKQFLFKHYEYLYLYFLLCFYRDYNNFHFLIENTIDPYFFQRQSLYINMMCIEVLGLPRKLKRPTNNSKEIDQFNWDLT